MSAVERYDVLTMPKRPGIASSAAKETVLVIVGLAKRVAMNPKQWFDVLAPAQVGLDDRREDRHGMDA